MIPMMGTPKTMRTNNRNFTSAGIDNFELRATVTREEANALRKACQWSTPKGVPILLKNEHSPLILLRFVPGKVLADLNAPKLSFNHNVQLAGREQVKNAIRALETNTKRSAPRLNWKRAEVSHLHVTFTHEVPDFEACAALSKATRGTWEDTEFYPNIYYNANGKNSPVIIYDKVEHLRDAGLRFPNDVGSEMESLEHALFRFEARLNQSVYSELKKHGGWNELSFLAEDLCGPGFDSAMRFLKWKFERHVPIPIDRTPTIRNGMSNREYAALNTRRTANTEQMREQALADHNAGHITNELLSSELERIAALERRALAVHLHTALESEVKQTGKILVTVNGNLETPEFEHAPRTHRYTYAV
jgi:hypothetical protein